MVCFIVALLLAVIANVNVFVGIPLMVEEFKTEYKTEDPLRR